MTQHGAQSRVLGTKAAPVTSPSDTYMQSTNHRNHSHGTVKSRKTCLNAAKESLIRNELTRTAYLPLRLPGVAARSIPARSAL